MTHFWQRTFNAFREADFRWYAGGMMAASTAFRMEEVAEGWLVYDLTRSAVALSWVKTGRSLAIIIFSLWGGLVADRLKKRTIIIVGNSLVGLVPLVIAFLIFTNSVRWWHLAIGASLEALIFSFIVPARNAFLGTLMKPQGLLNAMALEVVMLAIPGVLFSSLGGALVDGWGAGQVYFLVFLVYGLTVMLFTRLTVPGQVSRVRHSAQGELLDGFRFVRRHPVVMPVLGLGIALSVLVAPAQAFLPVFAVDIFQSGGFGLGLLAAAWSFGRMAGSLAVAALGDFQQRGLLLLGMGAATGGLVVLFAQSPSLLPGLCFIGLASMAQNAYKVIESTILQAVATEEMRGRVAGFLRATQGMLAVVIVPIGFAADLWGAPFIVSITGSITMLLFLSLIVLRHKLSNFK